MKEPLVSIIIPCKTIDEYTQKCIGECLKLDYSNFEVIVLPDEKSSKSEIKNRKLKIITSGKVKPAFKRNLGMKQSKANFYAFIDSDAYPEKDWLKNAIKYFSDKKIGIVGGPNLTPPESNIWEKISGFVYSNFLVSGKANIRYKRAKNQYTNELPSCNYISKKEASSEYDPHFLTAEDSEFCFNCSKKGYKILYAKDVVVFHHRRDSFKGHLKQVWIYGRDIAWLSKKEPSLDKIYYSILSIFALGFFAGLILSFFNKIVGILFLIALLFYIFVMFITGIHTNFKISIYTFITSILTHFTYGFGFIYGLLSKNRT
jgi:cellulose synthase/poly-beta-1,6-N-acetylglucosamine synthase-like glycosyltransferase